MAAVPTANRLLDEKCRLVVRLILHGLQAEDEMYLDLAQAIVDDDTFRTRQPRDSLPREVSVNITPQDLPEDTHRLLYRFEKADMPRLIAALQLPDIITSGGGCTMTAWEALCCAITRVGVNDRV